MLHIEIPTLRVFQTMPQTRLFHLAHNNICNNMTRPVLLPDLKLQSYGKFTPLTHRKITLIFTGDLYSEKQTCDIKL